MAGNGSQSGPVRPEGWRDGTSPDDALIQWIHDDAGSIVSVHEFGPMEYTVLVEQYVSDQGWTSRITTHGASFTSRNVAVDQARSIAEEIEDGDHLVTCLCAFAYDDVGDDRVVDGDLDDGAFDGIDFVCVYESELDDGVVLDDLEAVLRDQDDGVVSTDVEGLPDDLDTLDVDVFPRPRTHVRPTDAVSVGDPTTSRSVERTAGGGE